MKKILIIILLSTLGAFAQSNILSLFNDSFDPPVDSNRIIDLSRNSNFESGSTDWINYGTTIVEISNNSPLEGNYSMIISDTNNQNNPLQKFLLVHEGNSLTVGTGASGTRGWTGTLTDSLNTWLHKTSSIPPGGTAGSFGYGELFEYINLATVGETTTDILSQGYIADSVFRTSPDTAILSYWAGDNDLAMSLISADSVFQNIKNYCMARKLIGYKIIVFTVIPRGSSFANGADATNYETRRVQLNNLLREHYMEFADALADFDNVPELLDYNNTDYFSPDKIHLNNSGYYILEEYVRPIFQSLMYLKNYICLPSGSFFGLIDGQTYKISMDVLASSIPSSVPINFNCGFEEDRWYIPRVTLPDPVVNERSNVRVHSGSYSRHIITNTIDSGIQDSIRYPRTPLDGYKYEFTDSTVDFYN